jgi:hypothetical protein
MRSLVVWGRGPLALARRHILDGAELLAWDASVGETLRRESIPCRTLEEVLTSQDQAAIEDAAIAWTKDWGRRPLIDGRSFRELYEWKGVSLWWFAELFLHHSTAAPGHVRSIETYQRLLSRFAPEEVEAVGLDPVATRLLARTCTAHRILFHGDPSPGRAASRSGSALRRHLWNGFKTWAGSLKARAARAPDLPRQAGTSRVLFLSHAAFWRTRRDREGRARELEHYFGELIPRVEEQTDLSTVVVAVGPSAAFRRRGPLDRFREWTGLPSARRAYVPMAAFTTPQVVREVRGASALCREAWRQLRASPALAGAFSHAGVPFDDLSERDLAATLLLQLPWAVRCYEEMRAVLEQLRPDVVCLYAESSGWGRAAVAAARHAGVPSVAIQHGIIYPRYYSYLHREDEGECPIPDRTAVFGEAARRFLGDAGGYPEQSVVVTGSPKFDALLRGSRERDRERLRERLGVGPGEKLLVVASRYRGIRDTHRAIGSAFGALVRAAESTPDLRLLVKPHPAESGAEYEAALREAGAERSRLVAADDDLTELLYAGDALCTVESLSAVEALVLDRPVLILNTPTNLQEMVEQGAALGVSEGGSPESALRSLLFDEVAAARLAEARARYLSDVACGVDGEATARIVALIRDTARQGGVVTSAVCD